MPTETPGLITVAVFLGFALDPNVVIKDDRGRRGGRDRYRRNLDPARGRAATMALLGRTSWYLPRWPERVLPTLDPHGSSLASDAPEEQERETVPVG